MKNYKARTFRDGGHQRPPSKPRATHRCFRTTRKPWGPNSIENKREMPYIDLWRSAVLIVITHGPLFQLIIWSFYQNYYLLPWYPCFNLKTGIIWSFYQNYLLVPLFKPKTGIIWSFYQNYHLLPWYPCFNLKTGIKYGDFTKIITCCPGTPV